MRSGFLLYSSCYKFFLLQNVVDGKRRVAVYEMRE